MRKKNLSPPHPIRKLERERAQLLEDLLLPEPLIRGSLSHLKRTCGKESCHCAKQPAHQAWVLMSLQKEGRRCQVVRQEDVELVRRRVETYRAFRSAPRRLKAIHIKEDALLRGVLQRRAVTYK